MADVPVYSMNAFRRDASGKIKPQDGGGGAPSSQTVTQTSIPEYARPYVEDTLGRAQAITSQSTFQPYAGQRIAGFTPMQAQAFQNVAGQQVAPQITEASNIASNVGQAGLGVQKTAAELQQEAQRYGGIASNIGLVGSQQAQQASQQAQQQAQMYGGLGAGYGGAATGMVPQAQMYGGLGAGYGAQGAGIGALGVQAAGQGFGAGQAYAQQATSPEAQRAYMSPYMQNVVKQQQEDARRQALISRQAEQAQAVKQGAFGGSRSAIVEAESRKNLEDRLADIQATGSQQAFQQAQQAQQFGAGLGIQGLQAGYQGLQTGMQGTAQGIQGAQAGLQGIQQAGQLYGLGMQGAGLGLQGVGQQIAGGQLGIAGGQLGISGQQAGMQGVQGAVGAGQYGIAGLGAAGQAAATLGQLGQTQFGQETGITEAMMRAGLQQQQLQQQGLDVAYQNYLANQQYPYQQLAFMQGMYSGLPLAQQTQSAYSNPSLTSQIAGLGTAGIGAYKLYNMKEGGQVRSGIDDLAMYNVMKG